MKVLYENKERKSAIRYNDYFDMIAVKTKSGVFCIPGEVLEEMNKDRGLVRALRKLYK